MWAEEKKSDYDFEDDIICIEWLQEIGLPQYSTTFSVNFPSKEGLEFLSRRRLSSLRLQDLPKMNITNYEHQKIIIEHVKLTLQYAFKSPIRRKEASDRFLKRTGSPIKGKNGSSLFPPEPPMKINIAGEDGNNGSEKISKKVSSRRRRSFDQSVWKSISVLRVGDSVNQDTLENIRRGVLNNLEKEDKSRNKSDKTRNRRWTLEHDISFEGLNSTQRANLYGNLALEFDMINSEMLALQSTILSEYIKVVGCEKATLVFVNNKTREIVLFIDNKWYKIPPKTGICGYCIEFGEILNITDAYKDNRFNP